MSILNPRQFLTAGLAAAVLGVGVGLPAAEARITPYTEHSCGETLVAPGSRLCTYSFRYSGSTETFVVPPRVESVTITAVGAPGAGERGLRSRGAEVTGTFSNLAGQALFITVGGEGWFDGYNGGGVGGGGGASDVRLGAPDLDKRILVAGGGGGWGEQLIFDEELGYHRLVAVKGGDAGQPGLGSGGQAGTGRAGGQGGGDQWARGGSGIAGQGGGGAGNGGGGGGGYFGGGGGGGCLGGDGEDQLCLDSQPGSGGGGSSLVPPGGHFRISEGFQPSVTVAFTQKG